MEVHASHIIPHMSHLITKPYFSHRYMVEPMLLFAIRTIASMRLSSHALRCDTGRWGTSDESGRLCTLFLKQVRESKYHTLIQCSIFDHIRPCFPHIFDQAQYLHEFLSQPQCALSIATFIGKVLEHRDLLITFTHITLSRCYARACRRAGPQGSWTME